MSEWSQKTLIEVANVTMGQSPKSEYYNNDGEGLPFLQGSAEFTSMFPVFKKYTSEWNREAEENSILMSVRAPVGTLNIAPKRCAIGRGLASIQGKNDNTTFLFYLLRHSERRLNDQSSGTVFTAINKKGLENFNIQIPPLPEQKAIAHILGKLDDKIELNRQMNQTLGEMAQALFKSWFVDFDPVLDNAMAAGPDSNRGIPEALQAMAEKRSLVPDEQKLLSKNPELASQFPSSFEYNETLNKWIPEGWEVKSLDEIANYQNGLALQKFRPENEEDDFLPVLKISHLKAGKTDGKEKARTDIKPECRVEDGDVIFSWSASLLVDIWCGGKAALNQHLFKVTSDKFPKWFYYLFTKHHLDEFIRIAAAKAVTMGHIKRVHLSEAKCAFMEKSVMDNISKQFENLINKQIENRLETETLTQLRDTLLPQLISGKIRVPEEVVERFGV